MKFLRIKIFLIKNILPVKLINFKTYLLYVTIQLHVHIYI